MLCVLQGAKGKRKKEKPSLGQTDTQTNNNNNNKVIITQLKMKGYFSLGGCGVVLKRTGH